MSDKYICFVKVRHGSCNSLNDELLWFGKSLGLFSSRDKNKSCYRIFVELLTSKEGLSSDELAFRLNITRSTVVHHLKRLLGSGLVVKEDNKYFLRMASLPELVDKLSEDVRGIIKDLRRVAEKIDKNLN